MNNYQFYNIKELEDWINCPASARQDLRWDVVVSQLIDFMQENEFLKNKIDEQRVRLTNLIENKCD